MAFPTTQDELEAAGYSYDRQGVCRGKDCRAVIHWWNTPKGKRVPLNDDLTAHFTTCKNTKDFERAKRRGNVGPRDP